MTSPPVFRQTFGYSTLIYARGFGYPKCTMVLSYCFLAKILKREGKMCIVYLLRSPFVMAADAL